MVTNQNGGDVHPVAASPPSPTHQLLQERLKAYENMYGSLDDQNSVRMRASPFSPSSDLQNLESKFRRLFVSDSNARQQPVGDHRRSNHFPLIGMNVSDYYNPSYFQPQTEREQIDLAQKLWFRKDYSVNRHDGYTPNNCGLYGGTNTGVMGREVPFPPSNHSLYDQNSWIDTYGYVPRYPIYRATPTTLSSTTLSRAKDSLESIKLQKVIVEGSRETIDKVFDELISHVCELMIDPIGHQVFQRLMEKCTNEQISRVLDIVIQQPIRFVRICGDSYGTRSVQVLMECLSSEEQISRFMVTLCHVAVLLTKSTNANLVIMLCFDHFSPSQTNCLLQVIVQNCYGVAIDQYGSCLLQQLIGKSRGERDPLIREVIMYAPSLCVTSHGNYVVQLVLESQDRQVAAALSRYLDGNYVQLSCDKYGSHVVQNCLKSKKFNSRRIINELLSDIDSLLVNPFGNYVIQTAWDVCQDDMRGELLYHINKNLPLMRCNMYGRKVLQKLYFWT